jgi:uncharacterized protein YndB with AHSA1/START domain
MAATAGTDALAELDVPDLVITRVFAAPPELVFRAWTDPAHMARWFGPRVRPAARVQADARPGGAWRACLRAPDGSGELWLGGVYREVAPSERLVFSFAWDSEDAAPGREMLVTITFATHGDGTLMTLHQAPFPSAQAVADHRHGWSSALDRLDDHLAAAGAV